MTLRQLLAAAHEEVADEVDRLLDVPLEHGQTNGRVDVREAVATMHPGCAPDQVLITNGATEALFLALSVLLEPGDRVVVATPLHEPIVSAARAIGCQIVEWPLAEAGQWRFDPDALDRLAPPGTKLILLNSPHNPTGAALSDEELAHILAHAERITGTRSPAPPPLRSPMAAAGSASPRCRSRWAWRGCGWAGWSARPAWCRGAGACAATPR